MWELSNHTTHACAHARMHVDCFPWQPLIWNINSNTFIDFWETTSCVCVCVRLCGTCSLFSVKHRMWHHQVMDQSESLWLVNVLDEKSLVSNNQCVCVHVTLIDNSDNCVIDYPSTNQSLTCRPTVVCVRACMWGRENVCQQTLRAVKSITVWGHQPGAGSEVRRAAYTDCSEAGRSHILYWSPSTQTKCDYIVHRHSATTRYSYTVAVVSVLLR